MNYTEETSLNSKALVPDSLLGENDPIHSHLKQTLDSMLSSFKDKKIGQKKLAKKIGIHERTFERLYLFENKPSYQTLLKVYKCFFNQYNDSELIKLLPVETAYYIEKFIIQKSVQRKDQPTQLKNNVDQKIQDNPILAELYIMAGTGPLYKQEVEIRFGQYGLTLINEMLEDNILKKIDESIFVLGDNLADFDIPTILKAGLIMTKNHFDKEAAYELNQNHIGFLAEGLTSEEYHQWLTIDQEAYLKKAELIKNKKTNGFIRAYTFMVTDKIHSRDDQ